jgi:hypothetical protein
MPPLLFKFAVPVAEEETAVGVVDMTAAVEFLWWMAILASIASLAPEAKR